MRWLAKQRKELRNELQFRRAQSEWVSGSNRPADKLHPLHPTPERITELLAKPPFDIPATFGVLFIGVPKTACTAIRTGLFPDHRLIPHHPGIRAIRDVMSANEFDRLLKIAFVRNPYQRLLSAFTYLRSAECGRFDRRFARRLKKFTAFGDFVNEYLTPETVYDWMHLTPQWEFVAERDRSVLVDFVGRYENLESDYATVQAKLQVNRPLPRVKIVGCGQRTAEFYDEDTAVRVYDVYREDFELFDYPRDSWQVSA